MVFAAPGLFTTVEVGTSPVPWKMPENQPRHHVGEPPGDEPTTSSTVWWVSFLRCALEAA